MKIKLTAALLLFTVGVFAQENHLSVDADFLTRGEVRYGGLSSTEEGKDYACFVLERTLLGINYDQENLSVKLTGQHSGTWGSAEGGVFNIYEAWVKLYSPKGFFTKIGRQNLSYDDQRIFGADDWAMTARSHDALLLGYEGHHQKVHLFGAFNQNVENLSGGTYYSGGVQPYKDLQALWYHLDVPKINLGASLLLMNVGMQGGEKGGESEKTWHQQLAGTYLSWTPGKWKAEAAYYRQMGHSEDGLPIQAWMASGKVTFSPDRRWSFYTGYDYLSGDEDFATPEAGQIGMTRHEVLKGFSSLYGSHHKFYGAMDFFYVTTYVSGFSPGLQNLFAGGTWKPGDRWAVDASYHFLATTSVLQNADKPLGHEVELSSSYQITKEARLSLGFTYMKGTETMVILKKTTEKGQLSWGWIMFTVTPKFFSGKW